MPGALNNPRARGLRALLPTVIPGEPPGLHVGPMIFRSVPQRATGLHTQKGARLPHKEGLRPHKGARQLRKDILFLHKEGLRLRKDAQLLRAGHPILFQPSLA